MHRVGSIRHFYYATPRAPNPTDVSFSSTIIIPINRSILSPVFLPPSSSRSFQKALFSLQLLDGTHN